MSGGTRMRAWIMRAGADILAREQLDELCQRFLREAARDSGGQRIYVPTTFSEGSALIQSAIHLSDMGFTFDEIERMLGKSISRRTFYRWKRDRFDFGHLRRARLEAWRSQVKAREFVYALGFEGAEESDRCVKVGMSRHPPTRCQSVARESGLLLTEVVLLGIGKEGRGYSGRMSNVEALVHQALDHCRIGGEWFKPDNWLDEAMTVMDEVAQKNCAGYTLHRV